MSIRSVASQRSVLARSTSESEGMSTKNEPEKGVKGTCSICMEEATLYTLAQCQHSFCTDCLETFLEGNITEHILPLVCPERDCETEIDREDVRQLVKPGNCTNVVVTDGLAVMTKFKRFQKLMQTPEVRECPKCDTLNKPNDEGSTLVKCKNCQMQYCLLHQLAHPPTVSCEDYEDV